jgi:hypothetical protein
MASSRGSCPTSSTASPGSSERAFPITSTAAGATSAVLAAAPLALAGPAIMAAAQCAPQQQQRRRRRRRRRRAAQPRRQRRAAQRSRGSSGGGRGARARRRAASERGGRCARCQWLPRAPGNAMRPEEVRTAASSACVALEWCGLVPRRARGRARDGSNCDAEAAGYQRACVRAADLAMRGAGDAAAACWRGAWRVRGRQGRASGPKPTGGAEPPPRSPGAATGCNLYCTPAQLSPRPAYPPLPDASWLRRWVGVGPINMHKLGAMVTPQRAEEGAKGAPRSALGLGTSAHV